MSGMQRRKLLRWFIEFLGFRLLEETSWIDLILEHKDNTGTSWNESSTSEFLVFSSYSDTLVFRGTVRDPGLRNEIVQAIRKAEFIVDEKV